MKHDIRVTQVYKVYRSTVVQIEAASLEVAIDLVQSGEAALPAFADAQWKSEWSLQNEEAEPA